MLQISVRKLLGQTKLDVSFVASGRSIALFGPSGSGKTSTLNMIDGLLKPDDGRVAADDVTPFDKTKRVYEAGVPIVYVSYAESELRRMSDTIVRFANGKVVDVRASHG